MYVHGEIEEESINTPLNLRVNSRLEQGVLYKTDRTVGRIDVLVRRSARCSQDSDRASGVPQAKQYLERGCNHIDSASVPGVQQLGQIFNSCSASTGTPLHTASRYSSGICNTLDNPALVLELSRVVFPDSILPTLWRWIPDRKRNRLLCCVQLCDILLVQETI